MLIWNAISQCVLFYCKAVQSFFLLLFFYCIFIAAHVTNKVSDCGALEHLRNLGLALKAWLSRHSSQGLALKA